MTAAIARKDASRPRSPTILLVHLWADRFEGNLTGIFQLQDQVTMRVVGAIEPKVRRAEIERALHKPTEILATVESVRRTRLLVPHWLCYSRRAMARALEPATKRLTVSAVSGA